MVTSALQGCWTVTVVSPDYGQRQTYTRAQLKAEFKLQSEEQVMSSLPRSSPHSGQIWGPPTCSGLQQVTVKMSYLSGKS